MVLGLDDPTLPEKLSLSMHGLFAGNYLTGVFYGLTTHQTFIYFRRSKCDPLFTRFLVLLLWVFDTFHSVLVAIALFAFTKESINNPLNMMTNLIPWEMSVSLILMSLSDLGVRGFYCYRIWRLSKHNVLLTSIATFSILCPFIAGIYSACKTIGMTGLETLGLAIELDTTIIAICVSDSILTVSLCVLLWSNRSGLKRTNSVISTIILYTVTSGLLPTLVAILSLILLLTMEDTLAYGGAFYMLNKLYFSSLLATLNRREMFRTKMQAPTGEMISISLGATTHTRAGERGSMPMLASGGDGDMGPESEIRTRTGTKTMKMGDSASAVNDGADAAQDGYVEIKVETHVV